VVSAAEAICTPRLVLQFVLHGSATTLSPSSVTVEVPRVLLYSPLRVAIAIFIQGPVKFLGTPSLCRYLDHFLVDFLANMHALPPDKLVSLICVLPLSC